MIRIVDLKNHPEYLRTIAKWHHDEWQDVNPGRSLEDRISEYQSFLHSDLVPSMFVAVENEHPLGTAGIVADDMHGLKSYGPWLASVFVPEANRKRGIGEMLVRYVMSQVSDSELVKWFLYTPDQDKWYAKMGWKYMEECIYLNKKVHIMEFK